MLQNRFPIERKPAIQIRAVPGPVRTIIKKRTNSRHTIYISDRNTHSCRGAQNTFSTSFSEPEPVWHVVLHLYIWKCFPETPFRPARISCVDTSSSTTMAKHFCVILAASGLGRTHWVRNSNCRCRTSDSCPRLRLSSDATFELCMCVRWKVLGPFTPCVPCRTKASNTLTTTFNQYAQHVFHLQLSQWEFTLFTAFQTNYSRRSPKTHGAHSCDMGAKRCCCWCKRVWRNGY